MSDFESGAFNRALPPLRCLKSLQNQAIRKRFPGSSIVTEDVRGKGHRGIARSRSFFGVSADNIPNFDGDVSGVNYSFRSGILFVVDNTTGTSNCRPSAMLGM
jgi:hypothetical protein